MKTELRQGEQVIKKGVAKLQKNIEHVVGKLFLTGQRLVFEAGKFNFQGGTTEIELSSIQTCEKCWTRLLGLIPVFPHSLAIHTKQGQEFRFVLLDRGTWAAVIEAQRNGQECLTRCCT